MAVGGISTATPRLRFPEFRKARGWTSKNLSDLTDVVRGGSPRPIDAYITTEPDALNWLKIGDVPKDSKYITGTEQKVLRTALSKTREIAPGDFILSNSMSFGRPYLSKIRTCIHDGWIAVTSLPESFNRDFLYYSLLSEASQTYFENQAAGGGVRNLTVDIVKLLPVGLPSPAEQRKIADCLTSLDEVIAGQGRKVEALAVHKRGLMQQLFPREGETLPRLRFPEFCDRPEWDAQPFEAFIVRSFYGTSSSTSEKGQYPVLRMGNMSDGGLDYSNLVYIDLDRESFEDIRLIRGDILLNRTNSLDLVGKISMFDRDSECITASYIVTYRLDKERIDPAFCNFMLNTPKCQAQIKALARPSVSQANINPTMFRKNLFVSVPKIAEQQRIASCLSALDGQIAAVSEKLDALKTHKLGLMQQLFPSPEGN